MSQHQEQEITLQSVGSLFRSVIKLFYKCVHKALLLVKRLFIVFIILIILGAVWGYMKDKNKTFENYVLVKANFGRQFSVFKFQFSVFRFLSAAEGYFRALSLVMYLPMRSNSVDTPLSIC